jgi:hypothetical protein
MSRLDQSWANLKLNFIFNYFPNHVDSTGENRNFRFWKRLGFIHGSDETIAFIEFRSFPTNVSQRIQNEMYGRDRDSFIVQTQKLNVVHSYSGFPNDQKSKFSILKRKRFVRDSDETVAFIAFCSFPTEDSQVIKNRNFRLWKKFSMFEKITIIDCPDVRIKIHGI